MSRSIIKKTIGIGSSTLLSRVFGYIREVLLMQLLGIGIISDAFFIAFRVPNSLRKVFAEGALSSVLVPALINAEKERGAAGTNKLLTASFIVIEAIVSLLVVFIYFFSYFIVHRVAPGASPEQLITSVKLLRILSSFILFLSSSSVLAAALQASHRFFIPALAPALLNCAYVASLIVCLYYSLSVEAFCWSMILASCLNLLLHVCVFIFYKFKFVRPDAQAWAGLKLILLQLLPCLLSVGIGEINFWIDSGFVSYLQDGTFSLLRYAYQMVNIPLGVIATSLSMVLLPHFSKIGNSKKELGAYLTEAIKFIIWMMLPITMIMMISSRAIFETMFFSSKFSMNNVLHAQSNMNAYLVGLVFFALEKILLNAFFVLKPHVLRPHEVVYDNIYDNKDFCHLLVAVKKQEGSLIKVITNAFKIVTIVIKSAYKNLLLFLETIPPVSFATIVAAMTIGMNFLMNRWLMGIYGGMGLALATSISAGVRVVMLVVILLYYFKVVFNMAELWKLIRNYCLQLIILGSMFYGSVVAVTHVINSLLWSWTIHIGAWQIVFDAHFFLHSFGYWLWFGPLSAIFCFALYTTRKIFNISFSYLD